MSTVRYPCIDSAVQCERVRRPVGGDNQEDETSHLQHVTPHQYLD